MFLGMLVLQRNVIHVTPTALCKKRCHFCKCW